MKIPAQLSVIALVLLLYYWPWLLFSGETPGSWLASAITVQLAFVIACNKLTHESWATAIIIVEIVCMAANIALFFLSYETLFWHYELVMAAFIIQLLIITISLRLEGVSDDSGRTRNPLCSFFNGGIFLRCSNSGGAHSC